MDVYLWMKDNRDVKSSANSDKEKWMILGPLEQKVFVLLVFLSFGTGILISALFDFSNYIAIALGYTIILICIICMIGLLLLDFINSFIRKRRLKRVNSSE